MLNKRNRRTDPVASKNGASSQNRNGRKQRTETISHNSVPRQLKKSTRLSLVGLNPPLSPPLGSVRPTNSTIQLTAGAAWNLLTARPFNPPDPISHRNVPETKCHRRRNSTGFGTIP